MTIKTIQTEALRVQKTEIKIGDPQWLVGQFK